MFIYIFSLRVTSAVTTMDRVSAATGGILLHLDIHVDEEKPRLGILELLKRLRPQWKTKDIQMKVSGSYNFLITCNVMIVKTMYVLIKKLVYLSVCLSLCLIVSLCWPYPFSIPVSVHVSVPSCVGLPVVRQWFTDFRLHMNCIYDW